MAAARQIHPFEAAVLAALFGAAIALPLARLLTIGEPDISALEKRHLAPAPVFAGNWRFLVRYLPEQIDNYFRDHFGFRRLLLKWDAAINFKWLHISPWAVIGNNGWIFYKLKHPLFMQSLSDADLAAWKSYLEHRQRWLAARGVKYLFVVAPDKDSVYQEFLPLTSRPRPDAMPVDQLARYLRETHSGVEILYLKETLLAAKKMEPQYLYYKQDGHWNSIGAYYGYAAIMDRLAAWFPGLKPKPRSDYRLAFAKDERRDIALQAGLWDSPALTGPMLQPLTSASPREQTLSLPNFPIPPLMTQIPGSPELPRAIVLRDSFAMALAPYLSESFSRITYFWPSLTNPISPGQEKALAQIVLSEKADVFIEEHVERSLINVPNDKIIFGGDE